MSSTGNKVVFLGSFDPPTNGHIHLISEALSHGVSEVVIVPAYGNPWKHDQTPWEIRMEMCENLIPLWGPGKVTVSGIEGKIAKDRGLVSVPTWMTLRRLSWIMSDFRILSTNETYLEIPKWVKGEEILKNYEFMIFSSDHLGKPIPGSIEIIPLPISSSLVREKIREGKECPEYIPGPIIKYKYLYEKVSIHH